MFNLSDKELDRLSREAADAYEVEKNTSSWNALEKRLDQELGTAPRPNPAVPPPRRFIFPIAYTSLIILLISSGYFLLKSGKKNNSENKINYTLNNIESKKSVDNNSQKDASTKTNSEVNKNEANVDVDADKITDKQEADNLENASPKKEKAYLDNLKSIAEKELDKKNEKALNINKNEDNNASSFKRNDIAKELAATNHTNKTNTNNSKNYLDKKRIASDELKNIANNETSNDHVSKSHNSKLISSNGKEKNNLSSVSDNNDDKINNLNAINEEVDLKHASSAVTMLASKHHAIIISDSSLLAEASKAQDLINLAKKNKSLNINRSLQIGISFAPDFSKVKYVYENYHIGTSIGVTIGYQLFHNLSVNSGVLYADKYYQADGDDFHQQQQQLNPALANEHVEFVRGSFKMIELPLNLRYDFSADGNTTFFVNGGLSSYFMLDQSNDYFCHDYVGAQRWIKQTDGQNQNYWFSMLNLSLGFETFLQKNISLQIDPYVKVPLRNIGVGNMRLSSYGINIGIKYSPVLKRSRH